MPIVLLVIVFGIAMLALQWFMTFAGILSALSGIGLLVWWVNWIRKNRA